MSPREPKVSTPDHASVLVPVFRDRGGGLRVILIRRSGHGVHGGQIAFPGGRAERDDPSPRATALRETHEEIGLAPDRVEVITALPAVHTRSSRFEIQPFLARVRPPARWRLSPREVEAVLTPTVEALCEPGIRRRAPVHPPGWQQPLDVPVLEPERGTVIWGATYRILVPLLAPLRDGHWEI